MKKLAVLAVLFLVGITAQASEMTSLDRHDNRGLRYTNSQPITFVQKGVTFFVYSNGEFDFRLNRSYHRGRRGYGVNAPGHFYGVNFPYRNRASILYDNWGNITKVGRNYIGYNRRGRVNQIGHVSLRYHRGRLIRVGGMDLIYNRRGYISNVNGYVIAGNANCGIYNGNGFRGNHFEYRNNDRIRTPHKGRRNGRSIDNDDWDDQDWDDNDD